MPARSLAERQARIAAPQFHAEHAEHAENGSRGERLSWSRSMRRRIAPLHPHSQVFEWSGGEISPPARSDPAISGSSGKIRGLAVEEPPQPREPLGSRRASGGGFLAHKAFFREPAPLKRIRPFQT